MSCFRLIQGCLSGSSCAHAQYILTGANTFNTAGTYFKGDASKAPKRASDASPGALNSLIVNPFYNGCMVRMKLLLNFLSKKLAPAIVCYMHLRQ